MKTTDVRKGRTPTPPPSAPPTAPPRGGNHPAHEAALIGLWLARAAVNVFLDEHEDALLDEDHDCEGHATCEACGLLVLYRCMNGLSRCLDWMESDLHGNAIPFGPA